MATKDPFALEPIPRRVTHLIFMVDTSGSMSGAKIASLNTAVRDALDDVGEISKNCGDSQIKISVLEFSSSVSWMYAQPVEAEKFQWQDLSASGTTAFGGACAELNAKLSKSNGFMGEKTGCRAPAIILLSDGVPTDEYAHRLEKLKDNRWFKAGVKVAISIGDDADKSVLQEFTGSSESVITVHNVDQLKKMIHTVSVSASMVASQSASVGAEMATPNDLVAKNISNTVQNDAALSGVDLGSSKTNSGTDDWSGWN
jgi:uncharacterized protein YegL